MDELEGIQRKVSLERKGLEGIFLYMKDLKCILYGLEVIQVGKNNVLQKKEGSK